MRTAALHSAPLHLVVLGHPAPGSFNHAIADTYARAVEGWRQRCVVRDLYANGFDPLLKAHERPEAANFKLSADVECELAQVREASVVTLVYPLWFGLPPAMIIGYIDRVMGAGFAARDLKQGAPNPLLAGKALRLFTTSASTRPWLEERGQWLSLRTAVDHYLTAAFSMSGNQHRHFDAVVTPLHPSYARECLAVVEADARETCAALLAEAHRERNAGRMSHETGITRAESNARA